MLARVGLSPTHDLRLSYLICYFAGLEKDFILDTCGNSHVGESPDITLLACFIASYPNEIIIKCGLLGSCEMGCQVESKTA